MGLRTASARRPLAATAMAPALTETSQPQGFEHPINGKPACNAFDNLNTLALATELIKADVAMADQHPQDPVEFFTEDIMQVIKSMESSAAAELLFNDVDIEEPADAKEAEARTKELLARVTTTQMRLERRLAFLMRRTRKLQARGLSQHFSQEIAGVFEMGHRTMRKKRLDSGRVIYRKIEDRPYTPPAIRVEGDYGKSNELKTPSLIAFPTGHPLFIGPAVQPRNYVVRDPLRLCENDDHLYSQLDPSTNNNTLIRQTDVNPKSVRAPLRRSSKNFNSADIHLKPSVSNLMGFSNSNSKNISTDVPNTVLDLRKEGTVVDNVHNDEDCSNLNKESTNFKGPSESPELNLIEPESPNFNLKYPENNSSLNLDNKNISEHNLNSVNVVNKSVNNVDKKSNELEKLIVDKLLNSHAGDSTKKKNNFILLQDVSLNTNSNANSSHFVMQESGTKKPTESITPYHKPVTTILHDHLSRPLQTCDDIKKPLLPSSVKNLCKKFGIATAMQGNNAFRQRHTTPGRYFGSGSVVVGTQPRGSSAVPLSNFPVETKREMQRVTGHLVSELKMVQDGLDSEATASSSGGESCDEMQPYTNPHRQYLPICKRAAWKYATERAAIAARWTWLQAQVSDLEYKIRQYSELHRRIRASKDRIRMGGTSPPRNPPVSPTPTSVNGYRGQLPGASPTKSCDSSIDIQCSRTRPLLHFRKRKLLSLNGLHLVSKKAARPANVRCTCSTPEEECALCTGRIDPLNPRDVPDYLSTNEMLGLLDSSYHPIFSLEDDASSSLHMEAVMKTEDWQTRSTARTHQKTIRFPKMERPEKIGSGDHRPSRKSEHRKKNNRLRQSTANALTAKIKNRYRGKKNTRLSSSIDGADEEVESLGIGSTNSTGKFDSPSSSPLLSTQTISGFTKRNRADSYDIDNIIIPYSVAASTRVQKLQYKEILTPKWRIADHEFTAKYDPKNNGIVKASQEISTEDYEEEEDISEEAMTQRHEKCEQDEKKKFLSYLKLPIGYGRSRSSRRTDSRAESSGANTPDPMSPAQASHNTSEHPSDSPMTTPPATPGPAVEDIATRRRTSSHSKQSSSTAITSTSTSPTEKEPSCSLPELPEVLPYDKRTFPIPDETYDRMLKSMPEHHKVTTNVRSQDSFTLISSPPTTSEPEHDSESTESAFGDEDPNDPEWDLERVKDKYRR